MSDPVVEALREPSRSSDEARLYRLQFLASLSLVAALVLGLGAYFMWQDWQDFEADVQRSEQTYLDEQDQTLQQEVENARSYLAFMRSRTEPLLKEQLRLKVDEAHTIARSIYDREKGRLSPDELKEAIKATLRPLRFFEGRGYYVIDDLEGRNVLFPVRRDVEGKSRLDERDAEGTYVVRRMIEGMSNPDRSAFVRQSVHAATGAGYSMTGGGGDLMAGGRSEKLAYGRLFEPLGWIIGAEDQLVVTERRLQQEALARLQVLRFGNGGSMGVVNTDGLILVAPTAENTVGLRSYELPWKRDRDLIFQFQDRSLRGGGMMRYEWEHPQTRARIWRMSQVSVPAAWGWILIASTHLEDRDRIMQIRRAETGRALQGRLVTTGSILALALAASVALSWFLTRLIRRIVTRYQTSARVSDRMLRERARQLYLANFFVDHVSEIVVLADADLRIAYVNTFGAQALGAPAEELIGREADLLADFAAQGDAAREQYETVYRTRDGRLLELEVTASRIAYEGDVYCCAIARDISARKRAEWELRLSAKVFDNAAEGIIVTNERNRIVAVNDAFCRITGYSREEVIGEDPGILGSGREEAGFFAEMWAQLDGGGQWEGEIWNRRKSGETYLEWLSIQAVRNEAGEVVNFIAVFSDITESRAQEERIRHLAQYDFLTNLPNRFLLRDRLERALAIAERHGTRVALLFVDLDRFKTINDSLGHAIGDRLLCEVGERLLETVRSSDTVSRQGGDEFVILINDVATAEAAGTVARKILRALAHPFAIAGHDLQISPSIGIAVYPEDGTAIDTLLKNADIAMYAAKEAGRANYQFFTPEMNRRASDRMWVESNLRRAIANREMELHYQPQFSTDGRQLVGVEALVRWRQPDGRLIPPGQFIPVAEDTGLIIPLGDWVLGEACRRMAEFRKHGPLVMAVNLSSVQLRREGLAERVASWLTAYDLPAGCLELEVTESVLMDDSELVARTLARLREMGVMLAIDDFGTGYSSLSYLKRFRVDKLKIDRSFVQGLSSGEEDGDAIPEAIISMARSLRMRTLAEGVETEEQFERLAGLGCEQIQGYLLGRPMPLEDFRAFLSACNPPLPEPELEPAASVA
ncbi:EAL domain-containing protein [Azospirillum sp. SYSU D00513]|uniref:bifunctional diguanylate cyclase/phosphodiesterase n=1 Tax=Azospirillum sp. SYSU D00513 TaxID=2812561 RepID=UPI001A9600F8|nr:EAL domain-containing protein [Azospirillum sp. SYSU D00513]